LKIVIALGGNALISSKEQGKHSEILRNCKNTIEQLKPLLTKNKVIITHGNGREIGTLVLQNEKTEQEIPKMPLDILDAETEGQLGYMIGQTVKNITKKNVVTVLTQVLVDKKDKGFKNPTKFIGPFYTKEKAQKLSKQGYVIKKDSNRGYRRVVASPLPQEIIELPVIEHLLNKHMTVIATGGGGIPVIKEKARLKGVEAVIDKDLASSLLAQKINANLLIIITDVNKVHLNFGEKNQIALSKLKVSEAKKYQKENQFPPGSMGPKIQAAINFLTKPNRKVIITNIKNIRKALEGKEGTLITKG